MTRDARLIDAFSQIGIDIGGLTRDVGDVSQLNTTTKTSLVAALNEVLAALQAKTDIDDSAASTSSTYSSAKIEEKISTSIEELINGAPAAFDTLKELGDALSNNSDAVAAINAALSKRVRVDAAQTFTEAEKAQGRANIGAASQSDLNALDGRVGAVETVAADAATAAAQNRTAHTELAGALGPLDTDYRQVYLDAKAQAMAA